ncbi:MAG: long-chain-acyl-CoA synthetase [Hyphomicrobiales bacterium]|nr:long-chain-acyl-CoA synthetase [Hyphomicrobiales bacterium]MDE2114616.1 long-chain-acyl-CoA synthetase [Hyphomicrobiales bacterium]
MNAALPDARSPNKIWLQALAATASLHANSQRLLGDVVEEWAQKQPQAPAILSDRGSLSYEELAKAMRRYVRWAVSAGLKPGDCVALMAQNRGETLAAWLGLTRLGIVVALINCHLRGVALSHCLAAAGAKVLLLAGELAAEIDAAALENAPTLLTMEAEGAFSRALLAQKDTPIDFDGLWGAEAVARPSLSDPALLIYTSGTTGLPKAAFVSHHRVMSWSFWFCAMLDASPRDRLYDCLPLYHSVGGVVAPGAMLAAGGAVVVAEKFSASQFWADISRWDCTIFQYIGELCRYLLNAPPQPLERGHRLRCICGNGLSGEVWEAFQARFAIPRIFEFYAATEGNFSLYNVEGRVGAIGRVPGFLAHRFPLALVRFDRERGAPYRNAAGFCERVAVGEAGEAIGWIDPSRGASGRFEGYTNAQETQNKRLDHVFAPGDAWFRTGDLMRADAQGFYYFVDRIGDTFRWKGENVATSEVARVMAMVAGIAEVSVYGVEVAGADGRAGMAALVVRDGFDIGGLARALDAALPAYARPVFLRIVPQMALTDTFKQKKAALAALGFDPADSADALYVRPAGAADFQRLDALVHQAILQGLVRL